MGTLGIRWRLTIWFGAAMAVIVTVRTVWIIYVSATLRTSQIDAELVLELRELRREIELAPTAESLPVNLQRHFGNNPQFDFEVRGPGGELIFQSRPATETRSFGGPETVSVRRSFENRADETPGTRRRYGMEEVFGPAGLPLRVSVGRSLKESDRATASDRWILWSTIPVMVGIAILVGYVMAGRALEPVAQMINATREITAQCLDRRLDVPPTRDEIAELAITLNGMMDRLQRSIEELRRFTADAAHELRTPVAVLRSEVEVGLLVNKSIDEYRDSLKSVLEEAERLSRLADQLLNLSREDSRPDGPGNATVSLSELVRDTVQLFSSIAEAKQIALRADELAPLTIRGDQVRLERVLTNLLDNAIKYTPAGGRVDVSLAAAGEMAELQVRDTGPGIAAQHLPYVFDRFFRVDQARASEISGTGLGLSLCRAIVAAHHGEIRMESEVGRGTCVVVRLPLAT